MEEIKKIEVQGQQYGVADMLMRSVMGGNAQVIEWSHTHNMNDYKEAGTYRIKGERTGNPMDDNLPIMNQGSGHTIDGILYVLDSSLANGSGNVDDCTITQFLILSNRVGGQEGDMYMRSGYGPSKDDVLAWKPWEKYQTNMEVGVVSDEYVLNPSNPTQALAIVGGMNFCIDSGIYSGIYFPPKAMIGTPNETAVIQDPTAIETFVMLVINNYAAAGDNKIVTQIKFSVTNGGLFSMEKRNTAVGADKFDIYYSWSQWKSVGGGGGNRIKWDDGVKFTEVVNDLYGVTITMGSATDERSITLAAQEGNVLKIGDMFGKNTVIDNTTDGLCLKKYGAGGYVTANVDIKGHGVLEYGSSVLKVGAGLDSAPGPHDVILGEKTCIGKSVNIGAGVKIDNNVTIHKNIMIGTRNSMGGLYISGSIGDIQIGNYVHIGDTIRIDWDGGPAITFGTEHDPSRNSSFGKQIKLGDNVRIHSLGSKRGIAIGTNTEENDLKIEIDWDANKIIFSYYDKTAELPLT